MDQQIFNYRDFFTQETYGVPFWQMPQIIPMITSFRKFVRLLKAYGNHTYHITETFWHQETHSYIYKIQNNFWPVTTITMTDKAFYYLQCIEDICTNVWLANESFENEWWNNAPEDSVTSSESESSIDVLWSTPTISHGYNELMNANTTHVEDNYGLNGGDMSEDWDVSLPGLDEIVFNQNDYAIFDYVINNYVIESDEILTHVNQLDD